MLHSGLKRIYGVSRSTNKTNEKVFFTEYVLRRKTSHLLIGPRVGEPSNDTRLQVLGHLPKGHVLFDSVHPVLKVHSRKVHVADHAANVSDDRRKDEDAGKEIGHHEEVFGVVFRLRRLAWKSLSD